jgi:hypothetical protein
MERKGKVLALRMSQGSREPGFLSIHPAGVVKGGVRKSPLERKEIPSLYYRRRGKINLIKSRAYPFFKLPRLPRLSPLYWGRFID